MARVALELVVDIPDRIARLLPPGGQYELDGGQSCRVLPILLQESDLSQSGVKRPEVGPVAAAFSAAASKAQVSLTKESR